MSHSTNGVKIIHYFLIFLLSTILLGCANGSFSNIQNIRQEVKANEILDKKKITIMTFNIRAGGGIKDRGMSPKWVKATKENLFKIIDAIKSVGPDIIRLQEVRGYNQAKFLAKELNMNFAYSAHGSSNWWGLALLSKFEIKETKAKLINSTFDNRIALMAMIELNREVINVINVHYALENYNGQNSATLNFLEKTEGPLILLGDLNRIPLYPEIISLSKRLTDTCKASDVKACDKVDWRGTFYFTYAQRIDYIFVDPGHFSVIDVGLVPPEYREASDHIGYFAKVKLKL